MVTRKKPEWLKLSEEELKKIIKELAQKNPPSVIGKILRDQYGIPTTKVYGKKLCQYLKEIGIETNEELQNTEEKLNRIKEHLRKNSQDKKTKHKLQKIQSKVNILRKYYKKNNVSTTHQ